MFFILQTAQHLCQDQCKILKFPSPSMTCNSRTVKVSTEELKVVNMEQQVQLQISKVNLGLPRKKGHLKAEAPSRQVRMIQRQQVSQHKSTQKQIRGFGSFHTGCPSGGRQNWTPLHPSRAGLLQKCLGMACPEHGGVEGIRQYPHTQSDKFQVDSSLM